MYIVTLKLLDTYQQFGRDCTIVQTSKKMISLLLVQLNIYILKSFSFISST